MNQRLSRRFIIENLCGLNLSTPIRYERYYITKHVRIQKKNNQYEKEILDENNCMIEKSNIEKSEFEQLKEKSMKAIIRDSYLYLDDTRVSIKKYGEIYRGLIRVEVSFSNKEEMEKYQKENWMGKEITTSPLAFDSYLHKLDREEFLKELRKYK